MKVDPDPASKLVTQILFGEVVRIIKRSYNGLSRARFVMDNSEGYVVTDHFDIVNLEAADIYLQTTTYAMELVQTVGLDKSAIAVIIGSNLPYFDGLSFKLPSVHSHYSGQVIDPAKLVVSPKLLNIICKRYLNSPYLSGGRSPFGIDGIGFVQMVCKLLGINIGRQYDPAEDHFQVLHFIDEVRPGDLAILQHTRSGALHYAIVMDPGVVMHSYGVVRYDRLDHQGIYNVDKKKYTHELRVVKRLFTDMIPDPEMSSETHEAHEKSKN